MGVPSTQIMHVLKLKVITIWHLGGQPNYSLKSGTLTLGSSCKETCEFGGFFFFVRGGGLVTAIDSGHASFKSAVRSSARLLSNCLVGCVVNIAIPVWSPSINLPYPRRSSGRGCPCRAGIVWSFIGIVYSDNKHVAFGGLSKALGKRCSS